MTVTKTKVVNKYSGNASNTTFPVNIAYNSLSDIKVYLVESNVATLQTLTTHYTVADDVVTMVTAPTATQQVWVTRATPRTQSQAFTEDVSFPAVEFELALDKIALMAQENKEDLSRVLKTKLGETGLDLTLPEAVAGALIGINRDGNGFSLFTQYEEGVSAGDLEFSGTLPANNTVVRFDGTTGKIIQKTNMVIDDDGNMSNVSSIAASQLQIKGVPINKFLQEDDMASNRNDAIASQRSIINYVASRRALDIEAFTSADTLDVNNDVALLNASAIGIFDLTLPAASAVPGKKYIFDRGDSEVGICNILLDGSDTFKGYTSCALVGGGQARVILLSDGVSAWYVLFDNIGSMS